jgi:hypothetical protein
MPAWVLDFSRQDTNIAQKHREPKKNKMSSSFILEIVEKAKCRLPFEVVVIWTSGITVTYRYSSSLACIGQILPGSGSFGIFL